MRLTVLHGHEQITAQFPQVRALFDRCVNRAVMGEFDVDDLLRLAQAGRMYIGVVHDEDESVLAFAFEFLEYPRLVALNIAAMAGRSMSDVMCEMWPTFREFARQAGADCIQASCHPGMARILGRHGFGEVYQVMRSEL